MTPDGGGRRPKKEVTGRSALISEFIDASTKHGALTEEMKDPKAINREARRYLRAKQGLTGLGDQGREALIDLLKHPNRWVQLAAASACAEFEKVQAVRVLEKIAQEPGVLGFDAQVVLRKLRGEFRSSK